MLSAAQIRDLQTIKQTRGHLKFKGKTYKPKVDEDGGYYFPVSNANTSEQEIYNRLSHKTNSIYVTDLDKETDTMNIIIPLSRDGKHKNVFANYNSLGILQGLITTLYDIYHNKHPELEGRHPPYTLGKIHTPGHIRYSATLDELRAHRDYNKLTYKEFRKRIQFGIDNGFVKVLKNGKITTTKAGEVSEFG